MTTKRRKNNMLKKLALCLCLLAMCPYEALAYSTPKDGPARPVFVKRGVLRSPKEPAPEVGEDYQKLLQQVIELHNAAYSFVQFMDTLYAYKNAKIDAGVKERRLQDFTTCNEKLLGKYFSNPKKVWTALVDKMNEERGRDTAQLVDQAMKNKLSDEDVDALSGIPPTDIAKETQGAEDAAGMSKEELEKYYTEKFGSNGSGLSFKEAKQEIVQGLPTWKIGRDILLDLYKNPDNWGEKKAKLPLWEDQRFLLASQEELAKKGQWTPEVAQQLSTPLPFPQEIVVVMPSATSPGFSYYPEAPDPWRIYQNVGYDPYNYQGEMSDWFSVTPAQIVLKANKKAVMGANRLSQQVALAYEDEQAKYALNTTEKSFNDFLLGTIDTAKNWDLPFPSSLNTKGVKKWDKKQWQKVTDEDDWNSVRAAMLSKKESLMKKLQAELEKQNVAYTPVNAEQPTEIQLWMYALVKDANADVLLNETTIRDIDTRIKQAQEDGALMKEVRKGQNDANSQWQKLWSEQTKQLDETTCLGDGILNAQKFKLNDLLK